MSDFSEEGEANDESFVTAEGDTSMDQQQLVLMHDDPPPPVAGSDTDSSHDDDDDDELEPYQTIEEVHEAVTRLLSHSHELSSDHAFGRLHETVDEFSRQAACAKTEHDFHTVAMYTLVARLGHRFPHEDFCHLFKQVLDTMSELGFLKPTAEQSLDSSFELLSHIQSRLYPHQTNQIIPYPVYLVNRRSYPFLVAAVTHVHAQLLDEDAEWPSLKRHMKNFFHDTFNMWFKDVEAGLAMYQLFAFQLPSQIAGVTHAMFLENAGNTFYILCASSGIPEYNLSLHIAKLVLIHSQGCDDEDFDTEALKKFLLESKTRHVESGITYLQNLTITNQATTELSPPASDDKPTRDLVLTPEGAVKMQVEVLLALGQEGYATTLVARMQDASWVNRDYIFDAWYQIMDYTKQNSMLLLDGNNTKTEEYRKKHSTMFRIASFMHLNYGIRALEQYYVGFCEDVTNNVHIVEEERQYLVLAAQHSVLKILIGKLSNNEKAIERLHALFPSLVTLATDKLQWANDFLSCGNPIPASLLTDGLLDLNSLQSRGVPLLAMEEEIEANDSPEVYELEDEEMEVESEEKHHVALDASDASEVCDVDDDEVIALDDSDGTEGIVVQSDEGSENIEEASHSDMLMQPYPSYQEVEEHDNGHLDDDETEPVVSTIVDDDKANDADVERDGDETEDDTQGSVTKIVDDDTVNDADVERDGEETDKANDADVERDGDETEDDTQGSVSKIVDDDADDDKANDADVERDGEETEDVEDDTQPSDNDEEELPKESDETKEDPVVVVPPAPRQEPDEGYLADNPTGGVAERVPPKEEEVLAGYDPDAAPTEEEVSEAVHTEEEDNADDESKREVRSETPTPVSVRKTVRLSIPSALSDDMEAADERTEGEQGAESLSEIDDLSQRSERVIPPAQPPRVDRSSTLEDFAMDAQSQGDDPQPGAFATELNDDEFQKPIDVAAGSIGHYHSDESASEELPEDQSDSIHQDNVDEPLQEVMQQSDSLGHDSVDIHQTGSQAESTLEDDDMNEDAKQSAADEDMKADTFEEMGADGKITPRVETLVDQVPAQRPVLTRNISTMAAAGDSQELDDDHELAVDVLPSQRIRRPVLDRNQSTFVLAEEREEELPTDDEMLDLEGSTGDAAMHEDDDPADADTSPATPSGCQDAPPSGESVNDDEVASKSRSPEATTPDRQYLLDRLDVPPGEEVIYEEDMTEVASRTRSHDPSVATPERKSTPSSAKNVDDEVASTARSPEAAETPGKIYLLDRLDVPPGEEVIHEEDMTEVASRTRSHDPSVATPDRESTPSGAKNVDEEVASTARSPEAAETPGKSYLLDRLDVPPGEEVIHEEDMTEVASRTRSHDEHGSITTPDRGVHDHEVASKTGSHSKMTTTPSPKKHSSASKSGENSSHATPSGKSAASSGHESKRSRRSLFAESGDVATGIEKTSEGGREGEDASNQDEYENQEEEDVDQEHDRPSVVDVGHPSPSLSSFSHSVVAGRFHVDHPGEATDLQDAEEEGGEHYASDSPAPRKGLRRRSRGKNPVRLVTRLSEAEEEEDDETEDEKPLKGIGNRKRGKTKQQLEDEEAAKSVSSIPHRRSVRIFKNEVQKEDDTVDEDSDKDEDEDNDIAESGSISTRGSAAKWKLKEDVTPAKRPKSSRKSAAVKGNAASSVDNDRAEELGDEKSTSSRRSTRSRKTTAQQDDESEDEDNEESDQISTRRSAAKRKLEKDATPAKRPKPSRKSAAVKGDAASSVDNDRDEELGDEKSTSSRRSTRSRKTTAQQDDETEDEDNEESDQISTRRSATKRKLEKDATPAKRPKLSRKNAAANGDAESSVNNDRDEDLGDEKSTSSRRSTRSRKTAAQQDDETEDEDNEEPDQISTRRSAAKRKLEKDATPAKRPKPSRKSAAVKGDAASSVDNDRAEELGDEMSTSSRRSTRSRKTTAQQDSMDVSSVSTRRSARAQKAQETPPVSPVSTKKVQAKGKRQVSTADEGSKKVVPKKKAGGRKAAPPTSNEDTESTASATKKRKTSQQLKPPLAPRSTRTKKVADELPPTARRSARKKTQTESETESTPADKKRGKSDDEASVGSRRSTRVRKSTRK